MPIALFSIVLEACQLDGGVGEGSVFQWFPCDNGEVRSMSVQLGGNLQDEIWRQKVSFAKLSTEAIA